MIIWNLQTIGLATLAAVITSLFTITWKRRFFKTLVGTFPVAVAPQTHKN